MNACCAECGEEGGASLNTCKSCMLVSYCNAKCKKKHRSKHKKQCRRHVAELRDKALFKDPPPKEECPICFLLMPVQLICCILLPPATITSVPLYDFAIANTELASKGIRTYYPCCGKSVCKGCVHSFSKSGHHDKCPFCNSYRRKTEEERIQEMMRRVEANDATSINLMADSYYEGLNGVQQDRTAAMELYARSAGLGCGLAHSKFACIYHEGGDLKKAKFHFEAAAMAGHEGARFNLGVMEYNSGNMERAIKHWTIAASAGHYRAMHHLRTGFEGGFVSRESIDSSLTAYNNSRAEMRSKARDATIRIKMNILQTMNNT